MGIGGHWEWIVIGLVVVLLFGAKKIPQFAKGIGEGIKEFKKAKNDVDKDSSKEDKEKLDKSSGS